MHGPMNVKFNKMHTLFPVICFNYTILYTFRTNKSIIRRLPGYTDQTSYTCMENAICCVYISNLLMMNLFIRNMTETNKEIKSAAVGVTLTYILHDARFWKCKARMCICWSKYTENNMYIFTLSVHFNFSCNLTTRKIRDFNTVFCKVVFKINYIYLALGLAHTPPPPQKKGRKIMRAPICQSYVIRGISYKLMCNGIGIGN
jgi:hypothetical protein